MKSHNRVLTIAGSDSGGGAGIQADLKTISALGCYGMSAITAITAQNTVEVTAIHPVPIDVIRKQIIAVLSDIGTNAVKIGMLHNAEIIQVIAKLLKKYKVKNIVLDPVMVAKSGDKLLQDDSIFALKKYLFPIVTLVTPNLLEAEVLLGYSIQNSEEMLSATQELSTKVQGVVLKGGHLKGKYNLDFLKHKDYKDEIFCIQTEKIKSKNLHGTGCTLSSAIASFLALEHEIPDAVFESVSYIGNAIRSGKKYKLGKGHGPVDHFYKNK